MNSAPTQSSSTVGNNIPYIAPNFNFSIPTDAAWLRSTLWDYQQGYCTYCGCETRIGGKAGPDYAVLNNIASYPKSMQNTPANLVLCCTECDSGKDSQPVELFIYGSLRALPPQRRALVVSTQKQLRAYFDQFRSNKNKEVNDYFPLDLERFVLAENRKQPPLPQAATAQASAAPVPAAEDKPETEAEECLRWTKEIQSNIHESHLGAVRNILNILERTNGLHDEASREHILKQVYDSMAAASTLDELVGEVPAAHAHMALVDNGNWMKTDYMENFLPSEGIDMEKERLRVQKCLAMFNHEERTYAYALLSYITGKWHMPSALYLALKAANALALHAFKLDQAYANYPRLKQLIR